MMLGLDLLQRNSGQDLPSWTQKYDKGDKWRKVEEKVKQPRLGWGAGSWEAGEPWGGAG